MKVTIDSRKFKKEMDNIIKYTEGFLEGAKLGKQAFLLTLGEKTQELFERYIDSSARVNPESLQHVYEWYQTGSPDARLFEIKYTVSNLGLSFKTNFTQSRSIKEGSREPFANKAKIMENGVRVTVRPKSAEVLAFDTDDRKVFTPNPVTIDNPGGPDASGGFQKVVDQFFNQYFTQAFLTSSGLLDRFKNPVAYKKDLPKGKRAGKSAGVTSGYRWVANMEIG